MIASNYRKHPQALALQLPLPWGRALIWHTKRPGARLLRTIRAARSRAFNLAGRIKRPAKPTVPQWWTDARRKARHLAATVRDACLNLFGEVRVAVTTADTDLLGFNYEQDIKRKTTSKTPRVPAMQPRFFNRGCPRCENKWVTIDEPGYQPGWPICTNCKSSWHPDYYDEARENFARGNDDEEYDA